MGSTVSFTQSGVIVFLIIALSHLEIVQCAPQHVNLGVCCPFGEFFEDFTCIRSDSNKDLVNNESFQEFFTNQPNLTSGRYSNLDSYEFRFIHQPLQCSNGSITLLINSNDTNATSLLIDGKRVEFVPSNGYLKYGENNLSPEEYCFNRIDPDMEFMEIIVCNLECSLRRPWIRKCCDVDEVWDLSSFPQGPVKCRPSGERTWSPKVYSSVYSNNEDVDVKPQIITDHPRNWCRNEIDIRAMKVGPKFPEADRFKILLDGNLWLKSDRRNWIRLTPGSWCIDGSQNYGTNGSNNNTFYSGDYQDTLLFDCGALEGVPQGPCKNGQSTTAYGVSLAIASSFLLLTVLVYILLWEKQNIHGWTSLCYFASLFAMYVFTALYRFDDLMFAQKEEGYGCLVIAIGTHFFWLSTFCWMTVVNFDLWWTFRTLLPTGSKSKGLRKFCLYILFAVGIPVVIVGTAIAVDYIYGSDVDSDIITPDYGKLSCFMDPQYALLPYLYGPIGILLSFNLIFFTITVYDMYKIKQTTKFATMNSSKNSQQRQSVVLFAKLFLLMGIPWGFEVISWATTPCAETSWYWVILDYINIFQAVAIFVTFVCKSETMNSLEAKFPSFRRLMTSLSVTPEKAKSILDRRPGLKFLIKPLTRERNNLRPFSSGQTLSTGTGTGAESSRKSPQIKQQPTVKFNHTLRL